MSLHQNILGLIDPRGKRGRAAVIWMKLLHQSSVGADYVRRARAFGETKDFEVILSPETFHQTDSVEVQASPFEPSRQDSPSTLVLGGNDAKNLASVLADDPLRSVQGLPGGNRIECRAC